MRGIFIPTDILDESGSITLGYDGNSKDKIGLAQLKTVSFYQALIAEIVGTFLLVFFTIGFGLPIIDSVPEINVTLGSGLIVASLVWGLGHIGGAHMNPAVSLTFLATGETSLIRTFFYIPCQLLGSVLGVLTLYELVPSYLTDKNNVKTSNFQKTNSTLNNSINYSSIGMTLLNDQLTPVQGFLIEFFLTLILIITIFACNDKNRNDIAGSFPLTIGLTVSLCGLFGGKLTGASMNPARSFGPAFVNENWSDHWIYWTGPITGAIFGAFVYKILSFKKQKIKKLTDIYKAKINLEKN